MAEKITVVSIDLVLVRKFGEQSANGDVRATRIMGICIGIKVRNNSGLNDETIS